MTEAHPEVAQRVESATRLAEAFAVAAYRTGSVEDLVAGFRQAAGWEPTPTQLAKMLIATILVGRAAASRTLGEGDAAFIFAMMARLLPEETMDQARRFAFIAAAKSRHEIAQQIDEIEELSIWAQAENDAGLAASLAAINDLLIAYQEPWSDPELQADLNEPELGAAAVGPEPASANAYQRPASREGGLAPGWFLAMFLLGVLLTAVFWSPLVALVVVVIGVLSAFMSNRR